MIVGSSTGAGVESDPSVNPDNQRGLFDDNMGMFLILWFYDSLRFDISHENFYILSQVFMIWIYIYLSHIFPLKCIRMHWFRW